MAAERTWEQDMDMSKWQFFKFCTCGGTPKYKYKGPDKMELQILSARKIFRIFQNARPKDGGNLSDLKTKLTALNA